MAGVFQLDVFQHSVFQGYSWPLAQPAQHVYIDWAGDGSFDAWDEVTADIRPGASWDRGRSADFGSDAIGSLSFTLNDAGATLNDPGAYTSRLGVDLLPGKPVLVKSSWRGADRPHFFGFIQRVTPNAADFTVTITAYDPLRRFSETDIVVAPSPFVDRSCRDLRIAVLEDLERGDHNLLTNPSFEADTAGWSTTGGTLTRVAGDAAPPAGTACGELSGAAGEKAWHRSFLMPAFYAGQVYRFSIYLRTLSGAADVDLGIGEDLGFTVFTSRTVSLTPVWQRFTVTYTAPATRSGNSSSALLPFLKLGAAGTIRLDCAQFTRGQAMLDYQDAGSGRWPNWCGNGSFDGNDASGWFDGFANLVPNPSFEVDTSGWTTNSDAFHALATSIVRVVGSPKFGVARADVTTGVAGQGVHYALPGVFKQGVQYTAQIYVSHASGGPTVAVGIGSQGTPADKAESAFVGTAVSWGECHVTWQPTADRSDVHFYVKTNTGGAVVFRIDGASVFRRDTALTVDPFYSDVGPGGGGSFAHRSISITSKYGSRSLSIVTEPTARSGLVYDFKHYGSIFAGGRGHSLSLWLYPSSAMPYKVGIGRNKLDGAWDEASASGTAPAYAWTRVTVPWTPTGDCLSDSQYLAVIFVYQTDAVSRRVVVDGVRVIPELAADDFEMDHWVLGQEPDVFGALSVNGSALSGLQSLNRLSLTRHYIRPRLAAPYYEYVSSVRDDLPGKRVVEAFVNDFEGFEEADIDRDSIINIVGVTFGGGTEYYSDADSVAAYGPQPGQDITGAAAFGRDVADVVGPALIRRYKDPRGRPSIKRKGKNARNLASIVGREVDDLIEVTLDRGNFASRKYLVLKSKTTIGRGNIWEAEWGLEEHAY